MAENNNYVWLLWRFFQTSYDRITMHVSKKASPIAKWNRIGGMVIAHLTD